MMPNDHSKHTDYRHRHVEVDGSSIHVVQHGRDGAPTVLLLHGWPENWVLYEKVMRLLGEEAHLVAIDLPGVGDSVGEPHANDKRTLAGYVHDLIAGLGLRDVTLVGHDVGAQIVYAYLHRYPDALRGAVMMNIATPGVDPWSEVERNPYIWHFRFHVVPELPERLVAGRESTYFDYFFDVLAGPRGVDRDTRRVFTAAYERPEALHTGFEWYRAFPKDEKDNLAAKGERVTTPLLYLRGDHEGYDVERYVAGLRDGGLLAVHGELIPDSGHFSPLENPDAVCAAVRSFLSRHLPDAR